MRCMFVMGIGLYYECHYWNRMCLHFRSIRFYWNTCYLSLFSLFVLLYTFTSIFLWTLDVLVIIDGLWCLTPFLTIFQLYRGGQFYWWRKPGYLEKTTDLSPTAVKRYHIMLYQVDLAMNGVRTHNLTIDTDCTGSCKSNYHAITITTTPFNYWRSSVNEERTLIMNLLRQPLPVQACDK
jgi:hypothetical protein